MVVRRKGMDGVCGCDWLNKLNEAWERTNEMVRSVDVYGHTSYPDGSGRVSLSGVVGSAVLNGDKYEPDDMGIINMENYSLVIDKEDYYQLVSNVASDETFLLYYDTFWLMRSQTLVSEGTYWDLSDSAGMSITAEPDNYIINSE